MMIAAEYCLTGCILNIFDKINMSFCEDLLFFGGNPYFTLYKNEMLCSNVADSVTKFCYDNKILFRKLNIVKCSELKEILAKSKSIIANVDTKFLKYGKPYKVNDVDGTRHYILVEDVISENELLIKDTFIPTRPISVYYGKLEINEEFFEMSSFWNIEIKEIYNINKKDICSNVINALRYETGEKDADLKDVFVGQRAKDKFILDIENLKNFDNNIRKSKAYEMGVSLASSGIFATRKYLKNYMKREILNNEFEKQIEKIIDGYFTIQLMLVKCHFSEKLKDFDIIVDLMKKISEYETKVYSEIVQILD